MSLALRNLQPHTRELIRSDLLNAQEVFASGEIGGVSTLWLTGVELDYRFDDGCPPGASRGEVREKYGRTPRQIHRDRGDLLTHGRERARKEVSALRPQNDLEAARRDQWLGQVEDLTLTELVSYTAHSRLATPKLDYDTPKDTSYENVAGHDVAEYRFGNGRYQEGYYDNFPSCEIRTTPASPAVTQERMHTMRAELGRLAKRYGLDVAGLSFHLNSSFWMYNPNTQKYEHAHDLEIPSGLATARLAAAGMVVARRDMLPISTHSERSIGYRNPYTIDAGPERGHMIRTLRHRFEATAGYGYHEHLALEMLGTMGGTVLGLTEPERVAQDVQSTTERRPIFKSGPDFDREKDLHTLRAVQYSHIDPNGWLMLSPVYAEERGRDILKSLLPTYIKGGYLTFDPLSSADTLQNLLRCIHFDGHALTCDPSLLEAWWQSQAYEVRRRAQNDGRQVTPAAINARLRRITSHGYYQSLCVTPLTDSIDHKTYVDKVENSLHQPTLGLLSKAAKTAIHADIRAYVTSNPL